MPINLAVEMAFQIHHLQDTWDGDWLPYLTVCCMCTPLLGRSTWEPLDEEAAWGFRATDCWVVAGESLHKGPQRWPGTALPRVRSVARG